MNPRQTSTIYARAVQQLPVLDSCLSEADLAQAIERSVVKRFGESEPSEQAVAAYVDSLHAAELGLAVACAAGHDDAWEYFMTTYRPVLYRAARALTGDEATARELADALWAELYGVGSTRASVETGSARRSLLDYFHGRSQLATWLRSVLSQRHVDLIRANRRLEPLDPDDPSESNPTTDTAARPDADDHDRARYVSAFHQTLREVLTGLGPRDRLRLSCYYVQDLTLAETGRILGEHEATVSRRLTKARKTVRAEMERRLTSAHRFTGAEVELCYRYATEQSAIDLKQILGRADQTPAQGSSRRPVLEVGE